MARDLLSAGDIALIKDAFQTVKLTLHNQQIVFHKVQSNTTNRFRDNDTTTVENIPLTCGVVYLTDDDDELTEKLRNQPLQKVRVEIIVDNTVRSTSFWDSANKRTTIVEERDFFTFEGHKYKVLYQKLSGYFDTDAVSVSIVGYRNDQLNSLV